MAAIECASKWGDGAAVVEAEAMVGLGGALGPLEEDRGQVRLLHRQDVGLNALGHDLCPLQ